MDQHFFYGADYCISTCENYIYQSTDILYCTKAEGLGSDRQSSKILHFIIKKQINKETKISSPKHHYICIYIYQFSLNKKDHAWHN